MPSAYTAARKIEGPLDPKWIAMLYADQQARHAADRELAARFEASILRKLNAQTGSVGVCWGGMTTVRDIHAPTVFAAMAKALDAEREDAALIAKAA